MFEPPAIRQVRERLAQLPRHDPTHPDVRLVVQARARDACEYCLMPARTQYHVDHIVPVVRWQSYLEGVLSLKPLPSDVAADNLDNFAWSCSHCNASKGDRVHGRDGNSVHRLFHPRRDTWSKHFVLVEGYFLISGVSEVGRASVSVLGFNNPQRNGPLVARHKAILDGIYPPPWARGWGY
jgi:5-methylcytosine-specific restriction endonuclease McrA